MGVVWSLKILYCESESQIGDSFEAIQMAPHHSKSDQETVVTHAFTTQASLN